MKKPNVVAVIPARLGSTRFPRKALVKINGKPLVFYPWRQASQSRSITSVIIATDSREIARVAEKFGADVVMTSSRPQNGLERIAEIFKSFPADIYVNVQGDLLKFPPSWLDRGVADFTERRKSLFHTLVTRISSESELFRPQNVKAVIRQDRVGHNALWFSRFPLPFLQDPAARAKPLAGLAAIRFWRHIGIYFYRSQGLTNFVQWPVGVCEKAESLEQLRILENGGHIGVSIVKGKSLSIDSPRDLKELTSYL